MGYPMARHLAQRAQANGGQCLVWNRHFEKAEQHAKECGSRAATLQEAAQADIIVTCLPTSAEVNQIIDQVGGDVRPGSVWVDCTSGHPDAAQQQAARLAERGVTFLDSPVSGGTAGAENGKLTVMVGGDATKLAEIQDELTFAGKIVHVGGVGAGFAVKAVNNILLGVNLWATGEGLAALSKLGVDITGALDVINASSGRSNASENLIGQRVLTREFPATFALGLLAKDAGIATDVIGQTKASAPLLMMTEGLYRAAAQMVGSQEDHTAALKLIEQMNGVILE